MLIMNKHAYLILVHGSVEIYRILIRLIDDVRNDIFVHIDAKSDINQFTDIHPIHSKIYFVDRLKIYWGDVSQIKCELLMLQAAIQHGQYSYYHFLSGVDLPLKNQDYIHDFFDKHQGLEFVGYQEGKFVQKEIAYRIQTYCLFVKYFRSRYVLLSRFIKRVSFILCKLQQLGSFQRYSHVNFKKGANWVSITHHLATQLVQHKVEILNTYLYSFGADEIFIQTFLENSELKNNRYLPDSSEYESCMRLIDWDRGSPYTWTMTDIDELLASDRIFARKFSLEHMDVVKSIESYILYS